MMESFKFGVSSVSRPVLISRVIVVPNGQLESGDPVGKAAVRFRQGEAE
jgi:hypothetical protein